MAGISFLDLLFAEALTSGLAREVRRQERPPPDNFFLLPRDPQAWRQIQVACKKENMLIAIEITDNTSDNCRRMQGLFMDLAREHDGMPFFRALIGLGGTYEELRRDLGGVQYTPTFLFVFFTDDVVQRAKYEGTREIEQAIASGRIRENIRELQKRRVQLKLAEKMAEELAQHVQGSMEEREAKLKREYEEKLRRQMEEKDRERRLKEEEKKREEEEKKRQEEEKSRQLEQERIKKAKQRAQDRPRFLRELLAMDLETASIRDIKAIMVQMGVSPHDCFERKDLKKKLVENVPELRMRLESEERRESVSSISSYSSSASLTRNSFSENQTSESERADKLEREKRSLEEEKNDLQRQLDRKNRELDRAQEDLRRMTERANQAEEKVLAAQRSQESKEYINKPWLSKPVPKPRPLSSSSEAKQLQLQLLETRLLYTTTIEDYDIMGLIHDNKEEGIVLRAKCKKKGLPNPERVYAMKVLTQYFQSQTATQARAQFQNEYSILCQVPPHENIIHMYAFFFDRANPDISPEFKRVGKNMRTMSLFLLMDEHAMSMQEQMDILTEAKGPQPARVLQWMRDLLSGLAFLQSHQIVHRDLKLDNLLVDDKGRVVISDFGRAVILDDSMKVAFSYGYTIGGNNAHLSPEVLNAKPGPSRFIIYTKQAVWAAGVLAYELAGHKNPFQSGTIDQRGYSVGDIPPLKFTYCKNSKFWQQLDPNVTSVARDMLRMEPTDRPTTQECLQRLSQ